MTIEDRFVLDLADLRSLRLDCAACGASISFAAHRIPEVPTQCPACGAWWYETPTPQYQSLNKLRIALNALNAKGQRETGYRIRFEIDRPKS